MDANLVGASGMEYNADQCKVADAAGIATVVTTNDDTAHHDFGAARLVVDTLGEPGSPCTVVRGSLAAPFVTVAALRELVAQPRRAA